jgi:hypothetical protein
MILVIVYPVAIRKHVTTSLRSVFDKIRFQFFF